MLTYCLKCIRNTQNVDSKMFKAKNGKTMLLSNSARIYERTRRKRILSSLGLKRPLRKIPLLGDLSSID